MSEKLAHIRNKTHFHIDRKGVLDPKAVWKEAHLKGDELAAAVDDVWAVLCHLQVTLGRPSVSLLGYDGAIARQVAVAVEEKRLNSDS